VPTWEGILAPPGEYDSAVRLRRRCGLMSNYFDHLLNFGFDRGRYVVSAPMEFVPLHILAIVHFAAVARLSVCRL